MSGYRFDDDAEKEDQPDLAQHTEFHFKDREVEDAVTRARRERLEQEEREIEARRIAGLPLVKTDAEEEEAAELLRLDQPWVEPAKPAATAAAGEEPLEDFLVWPDIEPAAEGAPPAGAAPHTQTPAGAQPKPAAQPTAAQPTAAQSAAASKTAPAAAGHPASAPAANATGPAKAAAQAAAAQRAQQGAARAPGKPAPGQSAAATAQSQGAAAPLAPAKAAPAAPAAKTVPAAQTAAARPAAQPHAEPAAEEIALHGGFNLRGALDRFDPLAMLIAQISFVAMMLALGYIAWGIFDGGLGNASNAKAAQIATNIAFAAKVFRVGAIALALCSLLLMMDDVQLGPGLALAGIMLHFGASPILAMLGNSRAVLHLIEAARSLGFTLLVLGLLKCTIQLGLWVLDRPNRMRAGATVGAQAKTDAKQQRIAATATMFSPCWNLPFCREIVRVKCPAFLKRQRCWKFGRGCLCDQEMVTRIMSNAPLEVIKAPTAMSTRKPPCDRCVIFLEHQSMKFKMLSPLTIPITGIIGYVGWPIYTQLWNSSGAKLESLWQKLSFSASQAPTNTPKPVNDMDKYQLPPEQIAHAAQIMLGVLLIFFLMIYVAKFMEWAILKMRW